ncbi:MAG TPA: DUF192 domain-containing protein [Phycisphaerae bacterium]|jgi:hypothetical protein
MLSLRTPQHSIRKRGRPARVTRTGVALLLGSLVGSGCDCAPKTRNPLDTMGKVTVRAKGHDFESWIADDEAERQRGLMFVTADQMTPPSTGVERGMLFVFPNDQPANAGFWMKNTGIPLDIAFIRSNGEIVRILTMRPYDESNYQPGAPYRFALEVNAGVFNRLGIARGDTFEIPATVLQNAR